MNYHFLKLSFLFQAFELSESEREAVVEAFNAEDFHSLQEAPFLCGGNHYVYLQSDKEGDTHYVTGTRKGHGSVVMANSEKGMGKYIVLVGGLWQH